MDASLFFIFSRLGVEEADAVIENLLKVWMQACSSKLGVDEAEAVIKNLLKVWGIHACSLLSRVQRPWMRLTLSLRTF